MVDPQPEGDGQQQIGRRFDQIAAVLEKIGADRRAGMLDQPEQRAPKGFLLPRGGRAAEIPRPEARYPSAARNRDRICRDWGADRDLILAQNNVAPSHGYPNNPLMPSQTSLTETSSSPQVMML